MFITSLENLEVLSCREAEVDKLLEEIRTKSRLIMPGERNFKDRAAVKRKCCFFIIMTFCLKIIKNMIIPIISLNKTCFVL